ncbi:hypothetical protein Tco_1040440 [Tanacetum coccineum]
MQLTATLAYKKSYQNTSNGKGSKQATEGNLGYLPEDKLREICEKHYKQILPIMVEKVHAEKRRALPTVKARVETQRRERKPNFQSQNRATKRGGPKGSESQAQLQNPEIHVSHRAQAFSPARRRSPVSTTVFTRLGQSDKNVFTRLGERKKDVHSRLGPKVVSRRGHENEKRSASTSRSAEDSNHRRKEARNLIRSYVTCSSERQREIARECDAADRVNCRQPA